MTLTAAAVAFLLDSLSLAAPLPAPCPRDSVRVGPSCVDTYEASVWEISASSTRLIKKVKRGNASLTALTNGGATRRGTTGIFTDDYPCDDSGNDCTNKIYAASIAGVPPSGSITWFQAQQACANSGKRLLTNAEWQMAAAGTSDPGASNGLLNTRCNTDSCSNGGACAARNTGGAGTVAGGADSCISSRGVQDMVGNLWEWVADWVPRSTGCGNWGTFSDDAMCFLGASPTAAPEPDAPPGPGALTRGGNYFYDPTASAVAGVFAINGGFPPVFSDGSVGFRCVR
jgi:Sulfatase-modifying factor enzyme 1